MIAPEDEFPQSDVFKFIQEDKQCMPDCLNKMLAFGNQSSLTGMHITRLKIGEYPLGMCEHIFGFMSSD